MIHTILMIALLPAAIPPAGSLPGVADTPFVQEYHEPYSLGDTPRANDVRAVAVDADGHVYAATGAGLYVLTPPQEAWRPLMSAEEAGPAFDVTVDAGGKVWCGAWNGLYSGSPEGVERLKKVDEPIGVVLATDDGRIVALGPGTLWGIEDGAASRKVLPISKSVRAALHEEDALWIATGMALYRPMPDGIRSYQSDDDLLSSNVTDLARGPDGRLWVGCLGGVTVLRDGERVRDFTPKDGLPSTVVQCVVQGPDGRMWVGTEQGVTRYDGKKWSLRYSRRWLVDDDVRDVAFDGDGTAWVATAGGVSAIKQRRMTLEEKAMEYHRVCAERHVREPGIVESCLFPEPGNTESWVPDDDDNDGGYTAMYMAMESFRYAVTKDPEALANAKRSFDLMDYLQTVTETPGFFARTVVPVGWTRMHDANRIHSEQEIAERRLSDPRYKAVDVRWRPSADGKYLWKGDTSSDEVVAHFHGYLFYYLLIDDETERERARDLVRRIMDYIIENDYVFLDTDGTATRWGVWSPEKLNGDPDWRAERGINSAEICSFLKVAYYMTGDEKYEREYRKLLFDHNYVESVRHAKTYADAWITHIDTELLTFTYPALLLFETDPELRAVWRESLDHWYEGVRHELNPFANFTYAMLTGADPQLEDSAFFLRDCPLDLLQWRIDIGAREDIDVVRSPILEALQMSRLVDPSERGASRWDRNLWYAVQGDGGRSAVAPTFWLLPYWMGRYFGLIEAP